MVLLKPTFLLVFLASSIAMLNHGYAQSTGNHSSGKILQDIKKLNVLQSVLYVAAHPDDENNQLIAYLANEELAEVNYLSLTRGDGGQNLIGSEQRETLGILRTQELLEARKLDGGRQFFATANDFGFSKNPAETFTIWNKEKVLSDVVWIIRKTRPDIIITRYSHLQTNTHGHHTASSILAFEAFDAAADPARFPEQLKYVKPWQAKRLLWNIEAGSVSPELKEKDQKHLSLNVGKYNALLGKSYGEIAAESRTRHKCQGMGTKPERGDTLEYFKLTKGAEATTNIFDGIDKSWQRVKGGKATAYFIGRAIKNYDLQNPSAVVPDLVNALTEIEKLPDDHWKESKLNAVKEVIKEALGLVLEANTKDFTVSSGQEINLNIEAINRSGINVLLKDINLSFANRDTVINKQLTFNSLQRFQVKVVLKNDSANAQPYWLREKCTPGNFNVKDQQETGIAENRSLLTISFNVQINGYAITYSFPVKNKYTDPVLGEVYQSVAVTPPIFINLAKKVYVFPDDKAQKIAINIKSGKDNIQGRAFIKAPTDWQINPQYISFDLQQKNSELSVEFTVIPPANADETELSAVAELQGKFYKQGLKLIKYEHIQTQVYFPEATAKVVKLDLKKAGNKIAYITGAADLIPENLQQAGYEVTILKESQITAADLAKFKAVIIGIRAYNVNDRLHFYKNELLKYVENGGNLVVQYNTNFDLKSTDIGPFPLELSDHRITDEHAAATFLIPTHPVLNYPNKITQRDFEGWVQERGAYFPSAWSSKYEPVLSFHDQGEPELKGSLLIAPYGKGFYVYSSLSWFRQLPAGVPGAYRLFSNIIGLGQLH